MRSSRVVRSFSILIAITGLCVPAMDASAQRRGSIDTETIQSTKPLGDDQRTQVEAFVEEALEQLADNDPAEIVAARDALIEIARRPGVTGVFLRAFSEAIVPGVEPMIADEEAMPAENALRILAFLRTPEATGLIVDTLDPTQTPDAARRLVAAGLLPIAVDNVSQSGLGSALLVSTARGIAEAAASETDWLVALEELRGLNAIALHPGLTKENREQVRGVQFDTFAAIARRIESNSSPDPLVQAVYRAILGLRGKLLDNALASDVNTSDIARTLRGMLMDIAKAAANQWRGLDEDPAMFEAYEGTLRVGAQLLSLLEGRQDDNINAVAAALTSALQTIPGSPERRAAKSAFESALAKAS